MFINVEETPNPDTLKFIPEQNIDVDKSFIFKKNDDLKGSSFLSTLFDIEGVESVLVDKEFISISKSKEASWDVLRTILTTKIGSMLEFDNYKVGIDHHNKNKKTKNKELTEVEKIICDLLETRVKPVVASHGGEISFHSFDKGKVYLELKGSCAGCPSSTATLKMGIENMLKHYHPDIKEVVEVSN
tara:strand:- start:1 stop:561 length:561 start_codon:yes stop_codon:yes gene_type:complete